MPVPISIIVITEFLVLIAAPGCLLAAWLRTGRDARANRPRERLRVFGYCVALAAVTSSAAATAFEYAARHDLWALWLMAPAAVGMILVLRPRLAVPMVPLALVIVGLAGIELPRHLGIGGYDAARWYGLLPVDSAPGWSLILVQAYAFLLLGGWLAWRELRARPGLARLVLGRMSTARQPVQRWGMTLLLVVLALAALVRSDAWLPLAVLGLTGSVLVIRRWPELAARFTTAGLILLGLQGLLLARYGSGGRYALPAAALATPGQRVFVWSYNLVRDGLLPVSSQTMADLAGVQAVALLGLGCWLVPRTFPEVRRLLGFATAAELTRKVESLTESRAVAVDTAAADLRRLERDLHDGAQARLVALGMSLRSAERLIETNPQAALALVAEAREASARALTELRELVRGVHPPVLADRGLADAVRALALDSPLSVQTDIDLPGRPPAPVETACYFAVAEILTNAAKHSGSHAASIAISHADGRLRIVVTDFGLGGADPAGGSGLAGVEKRLATFDGMMAVSSPVGGPTIVALEVPCALSSPKISSC